MVRLASAPLTKISFQRSVKFFLASLVGYLIVVILALLLLLQESLLKVHAISQSQWNRTADFSTDWLNEVSQTSDPLQAKLSSLRSRFAIAQIVVNTKTGQTIRDGSLPDHSFVLTRDSIVGSVRYVFDSTVLETTRRKFLIIGSIGGIGSLLGTILLIFFLPMVVRPVEEMLDHARESGQKIGERDEASFVIDTFKASIDRMKLQETELKDLHEREKTRADDLERITSTLKRSLTSGFLAVNSSGQVIELNGAGAEILHVKEEDTSGRELREALGSAPFSEMLNKAVKEQISLTREETEHRTSAGSIPIGLTTVPLFNDKGTFLGLLALFTDLTEIRKLETQVHDLQTLADLGEIAAGIAHEFRNSLSTILGYLKLVRRERLPETVAARLKHAEDEASLLSTAVSGLLNFARPFALEKQPTDMASLLSTLLSRWESQSPEVRFQMTGPSFSLNADPALVGRAFDNILRNSVESIREKKADDGAVRVELSTTPRPSVSVRDNGLGVAAEDA
ncbi:MAG TPA: PAS domain-containing protein, partial [Thermoanaerobaculia bacterium]|nr:PAS domain-containing protein [Thermoanaerobaculia bacterium]